MVRVSGCGPEGRRFEPGYPPHIFRSVPRPFTCRAADIAEGRRIFYVPAFAFTLPFCLLRIFAFFLTLPAFSVFYVWLSGFFPVCALYCIPSVLPALSGRSLPSLSGLRFLTAALSLFALLFVPFVCRPSCAHFAIVHFLFLSWLSSPLPRRRLRAVLRFFRRGNGRCRIDFIGVWLSW